MTASGIVPGIAFQSLLTCPYCGHATMEMMPSDACLFFHECVQCKAVIRPKSGDCCVFCSYGSKKCPPIQLQGHCCGTAVEATQEL